MKQFFLIIALFFGIYGIAQESKKSKSFSYSGCKYLEKPIYIVNEQSVYFEDCVIHRKVDAEPSSFKIYSNGLAHDANAIFFRGIKLNSKPQNLEVIYANYEDVYWVNNTHFYKNEKLLTKIDTETFQYLQYSYAKDKNNVYFDGEVVENADPQKFVSQFNNEYSFDDNYTYKNGKKVKVNGYLKPITGHFFKDATTVYKYNDGNSYPKYSYKLEPIRNTDVKNSHHISKTYYGTINDTLYFYKEKTPFRGLKPDKVKVLSSKLIVYNDLILYKGKQAVGLLDAKSLTLVEDRRYDVIVKDKNGMYSIELPYSDNKCMVREYRYEQRIKNTYRGRGIVISSKNGALYNNDYLIAKADFLQKNNFTSFKNLELVSIVSGYRMGCSQDTESASDFYILKNDKGFWSLKISSENELSFIGKTYKF